MKILAFSDLHGEPEAVAALLRKIDLEKPEILVNCGDFSVFGEHHEQLFEEIEKRAIFHYFVAGNHESEVLCRGLAGRSAHSEYIGNAVFPMEGLTLIGVDYANSFEDSSDVENLESLRYLITKGRELPEGPRILVSHFPPVIPGEETGSATISALAKVLGVECVVYGHLHEERIDHQDGVVMINPGKAGRAVAL